MKRAPYSIILLDEIEKAHPDLFSILLQVFEDGRLTDGLGNTVDFKNTIVVMTSNIGARHLQVKTPMGFQGTSQEYGDTKAEQEVRNEVKRTFNPEFLNRLDETIVFRSLTDEDLLAIIQMLVGQLNENLINKGLQIRLSSDAADYILEQTAGDRSYGARPLRRALQRYVEDPLSEVLIQGDLPQPAELEIFRGPDGIYYRRLDLPEGETEDDQDGGLAIATGTLLYSF